VKGGNAVNKVKVPSPAVTIVGRHNSGKTTIIENLILELLRRGHDVASVKHHSHAGFDIDYPGKDSYRHRKAGASETVIAAPGQVASIKSVEGELECAEIVQSMPGHDIIIVEGYRKSGLPTIEVMRQGNETDVATSRIFLENARKGISLGTDFTQESRLVSASCPKDSPALGADIEGGDIKPLLGSESVKPKTRERRRSTKKTSTYDMSDVSQKMPTSKTVAVVTNIVEAQIAAEIYGISCFDTDDTSGLATFFEERYVRPRLSVVIQAGGESKRMGQSKATVNFAGKPLICRLIERLRPVADELIITTNEPQSLEFLNCDFPTTEIIKVRDVHNYRGALPGLRTALESASNPHVAVIACDMVFASPSLVVAEAIKMQEMDCDAVVPVNKHGYEPFHAVYLRDTCLSAIKRTLDKGEIRAQDFFNRVNLYQFSQEQVLDAEPMGGCFINVNTPDELAKIEESFLEN
jgi:molybdopterin-guanine dinucleotide biosynthesis protein MobB